jgi:hypothetical protein
MLSTLLAKEGTHETTYYAVRPLGRLLVNLIFLPQRAFRGQGGARLLDGPAERHVVFAKSLHHGLGCGDVIAQGVEVRDEWRGGIPDELGSVCRAKPGVLE